MKSNINKFEDLMMLQVSTEDEKVQPDPGPDGEDPHHCQKCIQSGVYIKWLEARAAEIPPGEDSESESDCS